MTDNKDEWDKVYLYSYQCPTCKKLIDIQKKDLYNMIKENRLLSHLFKCSFCKEEFYLLKDWKTLVDEKHNMKI